MSDLFHFILFRVDHSNTENRNLSSNNEINLGFNYEIIGLDQMKKIHMIPLLPCSPYQH